VTRYVDDPRVTACGTGRGFAVAAHDTTFVVLPTDVFAWCIFTGPNLDLVPVEGGGFAIGYPTADDAIGALIGDPP